MKIIVFGGSGFLGNYLVEALLQEGHEVTVFDLKESAHQHPNLRMIVGDITDPQQVTTALRAAEVVYNMAAMSDIDDCISNPVEAVKLNILGNTILMDACVKAEVRRFILASTLYVYSSSGGIYRSTKQACESIVEDYNKHYNLDFTILRYGTPYGPGANGNNSVHRFLKQAFEQQKIEYCGTGNEMREYIHAHDAAKFSIKVLEEQYKNERVILSGPYPIKIHDFFMMINEIFGNTLKIKYISNDQPIPETHYQITPYSYNPKIAKKLVDDSYLDLGQGLLDCIESIKCETQQTPVG
jgi:UDP-glucose 4-epimerase